MRPRRRRLACCGLVLTALLAGCAVSSGGRIDDGAKDGFVLTVASYGESSSDGTSRYVGIFRNVGSYAQRADFSVTLLPEGGAGTAWTGRGSAEDIAQGETVQVEMVSDTPPPLDRESVVEFTATRG